MRQPRPLLLASLLLTGCSGPGWQSALTSPVASPVALTLDQPLPRPADTTLTIPALTHQLGGEVPTFVRDLPAGVLQLRAYLAAGTVYAFEILDADTTALVARRAFYERRLGAPSYTDAEGRLGFWVSERTQVFIRPVIIAGETRLLTTVGHPVSGIAVGPWPNITPALWRTCQEESLTFCERRQRPGSAP